MRLPLSISKITPPRFPRVLHRTRLIEHLQQHSDRKLILVLGPAAQGKSTLAVSWINTSKTPSAWINLGAEDAEPASLFHVLVHALGRALPGLDFSPLLAYPAMAMGPREELPLYRDWAVSLFGLVSAPVWIIFDGLDQLPPAAPAYRFLQVLVAEAPAEVHFLLLSREAPPLSLEALKMRQAAYILPGEELAFTLKETREFLKTVRKLVLPSQEVKKIHQLTEGWAGGLVLLCEGLARLPEGDRTAYLSGKLTEQFRGEVFRYFGEQIFASLPASTQEFLVKSAILEVVDPDFIKEFLGVDKAREILEDLAARNLFIQPIYDKKRGWLYRYHLLFRDFLCSKFRTLLNEEQQRAAYHRAGRLSEQRGEPEEAVRYFLNARAYPQAVSVTQRLGMALLKAGKTGELSQWLAVLPAELLQANPWLLFYSYMTRRFTGEPDTIFALEQAYSLFQAQRDVRGSLLALAFLIEASITRGHPSLPPIHDLLAQGEDLARCLEPGQHLPERANLWFQIGFAHYLRSGHPRQGVWACQNAYLLARDLGDLPLQIGALIHTHGCLSALGEFNRAEEIARRVDALLAKHPYPEYHGIHLIHTTQIYLMSGDLPKAAEFLRQAREEISRHGLNFLYPAVMLYDLMLKTYLGKHSEAEEVAKNLVSVALAMGNLFMHGDALVYQGINLYHWGDFSRAREVLLKAREVLSRDEALAVGHVAIVKILLGLIAYHLSQNGEAERELQEGLDHYQEDENPFFMKEASMALALFTWQQGRTRESAKHLQAGMGLAHKHGLFFNWLLNRQDLLRACSLALELGLEEVWDYAARLLITHLPDLAGRELERLSRHANPKIAANAWEVRRAIHRAGLPRLRIQTLGGFRVWRGETLIKDDEWEGNQPKLLLKAILAHGPKGVPKDVLMEDLWPNHRDAERNFKVILHRLRKALEPNMDKTLGASYAHLKANLISLDQELCQVDVEEFLSLGKQGEKQEKEGEVKEALASYRQALELYEGDFLSEDLYFPWAERKREELREKFLEILYRMAGLYEKQGTFTKAIAHYKKIIQTDPLAEQAYQRLMLVYAQRGMRSAALKVYEDCQQALHKELSAEPDKVTTAIYRKILGGSDMPA
jgi:LuxR family maltose regulon positive regulatory protein